MEGWREIKLTGLFGAIWARIKGLQVLLGSLGLGPGGLQADTPRKGRQVGALNTSILSPQLGCGLVQIMRQAVDGVGESLAWRLSIRHV